MAKGDIIVNRSGRAKEFSPELTPKNISLLKQDGWFVATSAQKAEFEKIAKEATKETTKAEAKTDKKTAGSKAETKVTETKKTAI